MLLKLAEFCMHPFLFCTIGNQFWQISGQTDRHSLNGLLSRTTQVSRHQKVNVDFIEAREDELAVASAGP